MTFSVVAEAETLTTASGERLLISGWWGCVRHPNYLGDIIIHWAFALLSGNHLNKKLNSQQVLTRRFINFEKVSELEYPL